MVITDFDTPIRFQRENSHNESMPVFKEDYSRRFVDFGYSLIDKKTYSHESTVFPKDVQERISTQILYKEKVNDIYTNA